ncbi:YoaK family protein [Gemella cuniculi]|uniref:YoaK family protein n=1 Tax=Gemella cuniculi TaxID=150240 RepID=UPI00041D0FC6|nr:YoaK family protein [Gemella cuniculi]
MDIRKTIINEKLPVQEQLVFCLLLTLVGGFFDAYTYVNCGGIFANAQTGNLIFVGIGLIDGDFGAVRHYLVPIFSFIVGVLVSKFIESKYKKLSIFKHIYILLCTQIFALIFIFIKQSIFGIDIRPIVISFICAIQFDGFRKINNLAFASVFCTGNLRSMSEHMFKYLFLKQKNSKVPFMTYALVISVFLFGVLFGAAMSKYYWHKAILTPIIVMVVNIFFVGIIQKKFTRKTK